MLIAGKEISFVHVKDKTIGVIYLGAKIVWEGIRSCFGGGSWDNDKPWDNTDGWID